MADKYKKKDSPPVVIDKKKTKMGKGLFMFGFQPGVDPMKELGYAKKESTMVKQRKAVKYSDPMPNAASGGKRGYHVRGRIVVPGALEDNPEPNTVSPKKFKRGSLKNFTTLQKA